MQAIIITIGDEILVGQTIDTNSAHIAKELTPLGIKVSEIISISDTHDHIWNTVDTAVKWADFVIITGGLGPTNDDITKKVLTDYFEDELVIYPEILTRIQNYFEKFNKPFLESNRLQAMLPKDATIIENDLGTASGMWFKKGKTNILSMPGVPYEMRGLLQKFIDALKHTHKTGNFYHRTVQVTGIGESYLAELLTDWEAKNRQLGISVSYLPSVGALKLRLTGKLDQKVIIDEHISEIKEAHSKYVIGDEVDTLEKVIGNLLKERSQTLGTVESCTGGSIAKKIVSLSGSSAFYEGSFISYSNQLKENLVGVNKSTIKQFGAVSEQTVIEMAENGRQKLGVDYCISTSGIAGPSGGTAQKPVGTVWVAVATPEKTFTKKFNFGHTRNRNIRSTVFSALNFLRLILRNQLD